MTSEVIYKETVTDAEGNVVSVRSIRGNEEFTQVYNRHWKTIRAITKQNPAALGLFTLLIENMSNTNSVVISIETIAEILECSRMSVSRYVKYLREHGFIEVIKSGTSNVYHINGAIAWKSTNARKKYAVLNSNVVMSAAEAACGIDPDALPEPANYEPETAYESQRHVTLKE